MARKNDNSLSNDEKSELLRYFIGVGSNPPYLQDNRFRDLVNRFQNADDRPELFDERVSPASAGDDVGAITAAQRDMDAAQIGGANDTDEKVVSTGHNNDDPAQSYKPMMVDETKA